MIGNETVPMLEQRVQSIESRMDQVPAGRLLPQAREVLSAAGEELARDDAELRSAQERYSAKYWGVSRYLPGTAAQRFAEQELVPRETEVEGDRTAIARLSRTLRTLNQRVDANAYTAVDERFARLNFGSNDSSVLLSISDDARATQLRRQYQRAITSPQATTLAVGTADRNPDVPTVLAKYRDLNRRPHMLQQGAVLFATTGDAEGSYARFNALRTQLGTETATLLAVSASPNVRPIFEALRAAKVPERYAAALAPAAADAGATPAETVKAVRTLQASVGRADDAAVLAAAAFASGRTLDEMDAAHAHFKRTWYPAGLAASWALAGRGSITMTAITSARVFDQGEDW